MSNSEPCTEGWKDGSCCCNCKNFIELFKHPWNHIYNGSTMESTGLHACIVQHDMDGDNKGIITERKHGMCELHCRK